jgi:hypothetical protein
MVAAAATALVLLFLDRTGGPAAQGVSGGGHRRAAAIGLVEPDAWRALAQAGRSQVVIAAVTLVGVVVFGVLQALIVAVAAVDRRSADALGQAPRRRLGYVPRLGRWADVSVHRSARDHPGSRGLPSGRPTAANARYVKGRIRDFFLTVAEAVAWCSGEQAGPEGGTA